MNDIQDDIRAVQAMAEVERKKTYLVPPAASEDIMAAARMIQRKADVLRLQSKQGVRPNVSTNRQNADEFYALASIIVRAMDGEA